MRPVGRRERQVSTFAVVVAIEELHSTRGLWVDDVLVREVGEGQEAGPPFVPLGQGRRELTPHHVRLAGAGDHGTVPEGRCRAGAKGLTERGQLRSRSRSRPRRERPGQRLRERRCRQGAARGGRHHPKESAPAELLLRPVHPGTFDGTRSGPS